MGAQEKAEARIQKVLRRLSTDEVDRTVPGDDGEFKAGVPTSWVFRLTADLEEKLRSLVFNSGTKVNKTTIGVVYGLLKDAQIGNMTVAEFAQSIYDRVDDFSRSRAMRWSRTESAKVDNFGVDEGIKQTEFVDMKGWGCSKVPTSRPEHIAADGQEVGKHDKFLVGGEWLEYPGDPEGSAENVCECLCFEYPVVGPGTGE